MCNIAVPLRKSWTGEVGAGDGNVGARARKPEPCLHLLMLNTTLNVQTKIIIGFVSLFDFVFLFKSLAKNPAIIHIHISMYTYYTFFSH